MGVGLGRLRPTVDQAPVNPDRTHAEAPPGEVEPGTDDSKSYAEWLLSRPGPLNRIGQQRWAVPIASAYVTTATDAFTAVS